MSLFSLHCVLCERKLSFMESGDKTKVTTISPLFVEHFKNFRIIEGYKVIFTKLFSDPTRRVCSGCIKSFSEAGYEIKDNSTLDKAFEDREQVLRATNIHKLLPSVGEGASKSFQRDIIEGEQVNDISRDTNSAEKDNKGWKHLPLWQKILVIFAVLYVMGLIVQAFEKKSPTSSATSSDTSSYSSENKKRKALCLVKCITSSRGKMYKAQGMSPRGVARRCCTDCGGTWSTGCDF